MKLKLSWIVLIFLFLVLCLIRIFKLTDNELSWDVFGYYIYLPATFIHNDLMLNDISWIHDIRSQKTISWTIFQLTTGPENNIIYFFFMGMSFLYLPFFLIGHVIALNTDFAVDGFSLPYQYSLAIGCLIYTFIGLYYLRKILLQYFDEIITSLVLTIIVLGTNYLHHTTVKNLETVNFLFTLVAITTWYTIRWHQDQKPKYLIIVGVAIAITTIVKPSEIISGLIFLFWGVYNKQSFREKFILLKKNSRQIIIATIVSLVVFIPQIVYWKAATGYFIYDSYQNPGVGLDLLSPHIVDALFSFRKGWLVYTPIMIFALVGFYFMYKSNKKLFYVSLIYFVASLYIITSWTEWWYGGGYSNRPLIVTYVILALPLGYSFQKILQLKWLYRIPIFLVMGFFIFLNWFQIWQLHTYILDPVRTTKAYYMAIFLKTSADADDRSLLMIDRHELQTKGFNDEEEYNYSIIGEYSFNESDFNHHNQIKQDTSGNLFFQLDSLVNFSPNFSVPYKKLTDNYYTWAKGQVDIYIPEDYKGELPCLVMTMNRKGGSYGYQTTCISSEDIKYDQWFTIYIDYLTPPIRNRNDNLISYIWHRGKGPIFMDNFKVEIFVPKN